MLFFEYFHPFPFGGFQQYDCDRIEDLKCFDKKGLGLKIDPSTYEFLVTFFYPSLQRLGQEEEDSAVRELRLNQRVRLNLS